MATETSATSRDIIFVSYSHQDKKWLDRLLVFLEPYIKQGRLNVWADPYIQVGDRWEREISTGLARTCVGVLLVSQEFLASDFIQEQELPLLIRGAKTGSIILFVIAISASTFKITPLAQYQWANDPAQPLDDLPRPKRNGVLLPGGDRALSGSADWALRLWDLQRGVSLASFTGDAEITCLAAARDDLFIAGSANGAIHILELREPRL